jgi:hypothetical protein
LKRGPRSENSFSTTLASRRRENARRRLASVSTLASVISGSTTRRSSLAFGTVVRMVSCRSSEAAMLRSMARRCGALRDSWRPES